MDTLTSTLIDVLHGYEGKALNGYSYLTQSDDHHVFTVISIGQINGERIVNSDLVVRIVDNHIVIDRDVNDKPLYEALVSAGIPREQIILAYAGEVIEAPAF